MTTNVAKVRLTGRRQWVGTDEAGHSVVMDSLPAPHGVGEGSGIRPIEIVLHALAACTGMDVIGILEKKRQDVRGIEIVVTADQREDEFPKIYTDVRIEYIITGYDLDASAVERAIELSESKYCSVGGMLSEQVKRTTTFRIVEAPAPGHSIIEAERRGEGA